MYIKPEESSLFIGTDDIDSYLPLLARQKRRDKKGRTVNDLNNIA